jgi:type VI secretion system protein ImpL
VGELRWTSGSTTVAVTMKLISSASSTGDAQASRGFNGLRLPDSVVGHAATNGPKLAGAGQ